MHLLSVLKHFLLSEHYEECTDAKLQKYQFEEIHIILEHHWNTIHSFEIFPAMIKVVLSWLLDLRQRNPDSSFIIKSHLK
jgi:hypothetical protein